MKIIVTILCVALFSCGHSPNEDVNMRPSIRLSMTAKDMAPHDDVSAKTLILDGFRLIKSGHGKAAIANFDVAIHKSKNDAKTLIVAYWGIAKAYCEDQQFSKAVTAYKNFIHHVRSNQMTFKLRAMVSEAKSFIYKWENGA